MRLLILSAAVVLAGGALDLLAGLTGDYGSAAMVVFIVTIWLVGMLSSVVDGRLQRRSRPRPLGLNRH